MTLEEGKRKVYELIDEYGQGTDLDEDIEIKMADLFDIAQKSIAQKQRIVKWLTIDRLDDVEKYEMPADFAKLRRVWRDGKIYKRYNWRGKVLTIPDTDYAEVEVEYYAYPQTINGETEDSHEFEVREDGCNAMPFFVAGMILASDLVMDSNIYLSMYNMLLQELDTEELDAGGVRQSFYRGTR